MQSVKVDCPSNIIEDAKSTTVLMSRKPYIKITRHIQQSFYAISLACKKKKIEALFICSFICIPNKAKQSKTFPFTTQHNTTDMVYEIDKKKSIDSQTPAVHCQMTANRVAHLCLYRMFANNLNR